MSEKIQLISKNKKLKVRTYTTQYDITNFFKDNLNLVEIKVSFNFTNQCVNDIITQTFNFIGSCLQLQSLQLQLQNLYFLNVDSILQQLSSLISLQSLSIKLCFDKIRTNQIHTSIGEALKSLLNLEKLYLDINLDNSILLNTDFLELQSAYQTLTKITTLSISIIEMQYQSRIIQQLFGGMRFLNNLEYLSANTQINCGGDENYYLFCQEIKSIKQLKHLELKFGNNQFLEKSKQVMLQESILSQKALESICLELNLENRTELEFIKGIETLTNLKHIKLKAQSLFSDEEDQIILKSLQQIQKCVQLDSVDLDIQIGDNNILEQDFQHFIEQVHQIPNITHLIFDFPFSEEINSIQLFQFISGLKSQKKLQKLETTIYQTKFTQANQSVINDCQEVVRNLKELFITVYEQTDETNEAAADQLFQIINHHSLQKLSVFFFNYNLTQQVANKISFKNIMNENNHNLQEFQLEISNKYDLNDDNLSCLFDQMQSQNSITKLSLKTHQNSLISGQMINKLSETIAFVQNLSYLEISLSQFKIEDVETLSYFLRFLKFVPNLKSFILKLTVSVLLNDLFGILSEQFQSQNVLKSLNLNITTSSLEDIDKSINKKIYFPNNLRSLEIKIDKKLLISSQGIIYIFQSLVYLIHMKNLTLSMNLFCIQQEDCQSIYESLQNLKYIRNINIGDYKFILINIFNLFNFLHLLNKINIQLSKENYHLITARRQNMQEIKRYIMNDDDGNRYQNQSINFEEVSIEINYPYFLTNEQLTQLNEYLFRLRINKLNLQILCDRQYKDNMLQILPNISQQLQYLEITLFDSCGVTTQNMIDLGKSIQRFEQLLNYSLDVRNKNSDIDWNRANEFFVGLQKLSKLKMIAIFISDISVLNNTDLNFIFSNINHLKCLTTLTLILRSKGDISAINQGFLQIIEHLENLADLRINTLNLNHDKQLFQELLNIIKESKNLVKLSIPFNDGLSKYQYKFKRLVTLDKIY